MMDEDLSLFPISALPVRDRREEGERSEVRMGPRVWGSGDSTSATVAVVGTCIVITLPLETMPTVRSRVITVGTAILKTMSSEENHCTVEHIFRFLKLIHVTLRNETPL